MKDRRLRKVIRAIEERYPGTSIVVTPAPDDPANDVMLEVLFAPRHLHREIARFGMSFGHDLYGEDPLQFLVMPVVPEHSEARRAAVRMARPRPRRRAPRRRPLSVGRPSGRR